MLVVPLTFNCPPIPTPPATVKAPVVVETDCVVFVIERALVNVPPLPIKSMLVAVFL